MTQLSKVKQNIHQHKHKSCNLKKHTNRQPQGPTGLYELFLLTVPIEEVAHWQYIKQLLTIATQRWVVTDPSRSRTNIFHSKARLHRLQTQLKWNQ